MNANEEFARLRWPKRFRKTFHQCRLRQSTPAGFSANVHAATPRKPATSVANKSWSCGAQRKARSLKQALPACLRSFTRCCGHRANRWTCRRGPSLKHALVMISEMCACIRTRAQRNRHRLSTRSLTQWGRTLYSARSNTPRRPAAASEYLHTN